MSLRLLLACGLTVAAVVYFTRRGAGADPAVIDVSAWMPEWATGADDGEQDQTTDLLGDLSVMFDPSTYTPADVPPSVADANVRAFLDTIAYAEGTAGPRGYQTMFGYRYFDSYADHPRQYFPFTDGAGRSLRSSAAGRYQIIVKTWDTLRARLGLPDFSPASQDAAAIELIRERGALRDVQAGRVAAAISKCRSVWASLPGAGYAQPERSLSSLIQAYAAAGGTVET